MLNNITIKARLQILTAFICFILLLFGVLSLAAIFTTVHGIDEVYKGSVDAIGHLTSLEKHLNEQVAIPLQKFHDGLILKDEMVNSLKIWQEESSPSIKNYVKDFASSADYRSKALELDDQVKKSNNTLNSLLTEIKNGDSKAMGEFIENKLYSLLDPIIKLSDELILMHIHETTDDYNLAKQTSRQLIGWEIVILVLSILASLITSIFLIKSITEPLNIAIQTVDQVALGNTSMHIDIKGNDESSQLMKAMQNMNESTQKMTQILEAIANGELSTDVLLRSERDSFGKGLNSMLNRLREFTALLSTIGKGDLTIEVPIKSSSDTFGKGLQSMVGQIKTIISEIQSEVNVLTDSTQEIVTSINQVSTGTAETAAAVTETTTTVEELKQTAHISADKAKDVLNNAEETLKVVKNSEQTLQQTLNEMSQIQEKMRIISESIVKLSEHSMEIGEIINTVNNLAEQSNLLAVNAAIEAAKAGDQGKSFGVVAQEIRTLAEQSKEATVQVKIILNDIQNSTSAAVLATEQGTKAVTKGVAQSTEMKEAIHALSSSISRVAQAANQISISSQQQLVGVDQVTVAMTNINEASSQHVEHMRQMESSISSLNKVAISLKGLVSQYKISSIGVETKRLT